MGHFAKKLQTKKWYNTGFENFGYGYKIPEDKEGRGRSLVNDDELIVLLERNPTITIQKRFVKLNVKSHPIVLNHPRQIGKKNLTNR